MRRGSRPSPAAVRRATDLLAPDAWEALAPTIRRWQQYSSGKLRGFFSAELPSGMIVSDLKLMVGPNGQFWVAPPSVKMLNRDGTPKLGDDGKQLWSPIIEFRDRATSDKFRDQLLDALRRQHPEAFEDGGAP